MALLWACYARCWMVMITLYLIYHYGVPNVLPVTGEEDGVVLGALLALRVPNLLLM